MTDWKALCAELLEAIEQHVAPLEEPEVFDDLLARARAPLAQPEPAGPTVLASVQCADGEFNYPSDVVLRQYCDDWFNSDPERSEVDPVDLCRGAIRLFAQAPVPSPDD